MPNSPLRSYAFEASQPPQSARRRTHRSDCTPLKPGNLRDFARYRTHRSDCTPLLPTTVALCSLPNSPLRKHASRVSHSPQFARCRTLRCDRTLLGLASGAWPLRLATIRGGFVCRTLRSDCSLLGLPLGSLQPRHCSLPNTSPRLHASRDSQPPAARSLSKPFASDRKTLGRRNRRDLFVTEPPRQPRNLRAAIANELPVSERSAATSAAYRCRLAASCSPHCTRQRGASGVGSA